MSNSNSGGGIGLGGVLLVVFIVLKLCGVIAWSWWWAVQMAIDSDKDVFVFDQSRNRWFTYDIELSEWRRSETPVLRLDFAGIGTREIKPNGLKAIIDCYDITTKEITLF